MVINNKTNKRWERILLIFSFSLSLVNLFVSWQCPTKMFPFFHSILRSINADRFDDPCFFGHALVLTPPPPFLGRGSKIYSWVPSRNWQLGSSLLYGGGGGCAGKKKQKDEQNKNEKSSQNVDNFFTKETLRFFYFEWFIRQQSYQKTVIGHCVLQSKKIYLKVLVHLTFGNVVKMILSPKITYWWM